MKCGHSKHYHREPREQLYMEATTVGAALVPMWWSVSQFTTAVKITGPYKQVLDVALAGFLFHIAAEESGLNAWYLSHSHAAKKQFSKSFSDLDVPVYTSLAWIRSSGYLDSR